MERRITPSLVISVIALIVALSGASYAAITIPKNSVGNKQLRKNAVTSAKVKDGNLLRKDFKSGQLKGDAWYAKRPTSELLELTDSMQTIVSTPVLPPGSYVLQGRANLVSGPATSSLICALAGDAAQGVTVAANAVLPLSMSSAVTLDESAPIVISCLKTAGTPSVAQATIVATSVNRLTETGGLG